MGSSDVEDAAILHRLFVHNLFLAREESVQLFAINRHAIDLVAVDPVSPKYTAAGLSCQKSWWNSERERIVRWVHSL